MVSIKHSGKKNFRTVPDRIARKVANREGHDVVVACTRAVRLSEVVGGSHAHLGIEWRNDAVTFPDSLVPLPEAGKYSERNRNGREIVRKDLPMVMRTFTMEVPNYGDWSNGSHDVSHDREVYQREHEAPRLWEILIELLREEQDEAEPRLIFKFQVEVVLRSGSPEFDGDLLYALNLLQENVGAIDLFAADSTHEDYLKRVYVGWEILPPGERDATILKILNRMRRPSDEAKQRITERYDVLAALKPEAYISGTSGFQRYFGAKFADDLVVFENLEYGNAIYVMFDEWEQLSQQSRLQLLQGHEGKFQRIIHTEAWKAELKKLVKQRLAEADDR
jgi:hypothetical protein